MERKCQICGKDISYRSAQAKICENHDCIKKWVNFINSSEYHRYCEICGKNIDDLPKQRKICKDPNCAKEKGKIRYNQINLTEKICIYCGEKFQGTEKQKCCEKCRHIQGSKNLKDTYQLIRCKCCGKPIKYISKKLTSKTKNEKYTSVCESCKQIHKEELSEKMKLNNPMFNHNIADKSHQKRKENRRKYCEENNIEYIEKKIPSQEYLDLKNENKNLSSIEIRKLYMKMYNPMFNKEISKKVGLTIKEKYEKGEIPKYLGKNNWNYKGNRKFNKIVRDHLKEWIFSVLNKDNFKCQICGIHNNKLHVHHIEPLRDIIKKSINKYNTSIKELEENQNSEIFNKVLNDILSYHYDNNIGITVCESCHEKIDEKYHKPKYVN